MTAEHPVPQLIRRCAIVASCLGMVLGLHGCLSATRARSAAVKHLVTTFFGGSHEEAMVALLEMSDTKIPRDEIDRLTRKIHAARREGR